MNSGACLRGTGRGCTPEARGFGVGCLRLRGGAVESCGGVSIERGAWRGRGLPLAAPTRERRASTCCSGSSAASRFLARQVAGPTGPGLRATGPEMALELR